MFPAGNTGTALKLLISLLHHQALKDKVGRNTVKYGHFQLFQQPRCWASSLATWLEWSLVTLEIQVQSQHRPGDFSPKYFIVDWDVKSQYKQAKIGQKPSLNNKTCV